MAKARGKEQLGKVVQQSLEQAEGGRSDELQANRQMALEYYQGRPRGDEVEGRSQVVHQDVAGAIHATQAHMRDMLIRDAELIIEAEGDHDEIMARAESDICTDVLMKDNRGEVVLMTAIHDALLMKNGCVKVVQEDADLRVMCVPIENVSYTAGWAGEFGDLPFFSERIRFTRSELVARGIRKSVVDELHAGETYETGTQRARDVTYRGQMDGETEDQDQIECHEAYVLTDMDGDGIAERYRCLVANGSTCLEYEEIDHIPYVLGCAFISPHRIAGESFFDRLKHIQDSSTTMLRQLHDNVAVINNGRYVYNPHFATEEDLMNPTAGGGIRSSDVNQVAQLVVQDVTPGILTALNYNRGQRREAVGAALDMASAEAQIGNKAATTASIEKGNQELISSMIAGTLAETLVAPLYRLIRLYLRRYSRRPYLARIQGQAVPVVPFHWPERRRMMLRCGLPPGVKAMQQQAMMLHVQAQAQAMASGLDGILADEATLHRSQIRLLKLNGISDAESFIIDPSSPASQQARASKAKQAQQMAQMQQQMVQMQAQLEQAKLAEDARQHDAEIRHKYYDTDMGAEIAEAKISGQGLIELEKQRLSNEGQREAATAGRVAGTGRGAE